MNPPRLAQLLLRLCMRDSKISEGLLGDLFEEYQELAAGSRPGANRWYWSKALQLSSLYGLDRIPFLRSHTPRSTTTKSKRPAGRRDPLMSILLQDIIFAFRVLKRQPGFAFIVVLTLGLGIGANTAIFSVLSGVLLRPLPFDEPERLVVAWETYRPREILEGAVSYPNLEEWQARTSNFESLAGFRPEAHTVTGMGLPERVQAARVTNGLFPLLGVIPIEGRTFLPEDDIEGAEDVAIVSHLFWLNHFPGETFTGEQTVTLDGGYDPQVFAAENPGDVFTFRRR